jgi:ADP-glucose pyrophosphorylase
MTQRLHVVVVLLPVALCCVQVDTTVLGLTPEEAKAKPFIASMGIYVFKKGVLGECLPGQRAGCSLQQRLGLSYDRVTSAATQAKAVAARDRIWVLFN